MLLDFSDDEIDKTMKCNNVRNCKILMEDKAYGNINCPSY